MDFSLCIGRHSFLVIGTTNSVRSAWKLRTSGPARQEPVSNAQAWPERGLRFALATMDIPGCGRRHPSFLRAMARIFDLRFN
ncbi:MAG: hypothetical protein A3I66_03455 [Burkholderiales bacterium RIFCSPLOWO2_02_FULL_57_36]|nr:MAG: hypothetical protein A3I66_03455 [Burkholderiales bacterium RIFCSPLOWO2_02_FULL_57_36]